MLASSLLNNSRESIDANKFAWALLKRFVVREMIENNKMVYKTIFGPMVYYIYSIELLSGEVKDKTRHLIM